MVGEEKGAGGGGEGRQNRVKFLVKEKERNSRLEYQPAFIKFDLLARPPPSVMV